MLADRVYPAGEHQLRVDAGRLPSGVYFYRLVTQDGVAVRKMVVLK
jgi:hypothetical protein